MAQTPDGLRLPGLPRLRLVTTMPSDVKVHGFSASGVDALDWWRRLREAHASTGYWPVLMDGETPGRLDGSSKDGDPAQCVALAETLDGASILAVRGEERLRAYGQELAAQTLAELRGEGAWRDDVRRPGFRLPFGPRGEALPVTVALIPAAAGWQVPAVLQYDGGNEYPMPAEHSAILRYWQERYSADLVVLTGTTAEFTVGRPPRTKAEALALAWEYMVYNDGYYDYYSADNLTDLAASLIEAPVWLTWWD